MNLFNENIVSSKASYFLYGLIVVLALSSCNTKKYLKKGELYNKNNIIEYKQDLDYQNASKVKSGINNIIESNIKPNRGVLWIPKHWFYYRDKELQKDNWYWNFINKNFTEKPAVIRKSILKNTIQSMDIYLKNNGYFNGHVEYSIDTLGEHEGNIKWKIYPEKLFLFDTFNIVSKDTVIQQIIDEDWRNKVIEPGMEIDNENYKAEMNRVVQLLRNNGYPNFSQTYIDKFGVDTTGESNVGTMRVLTPHGTDHHPRFKNRNIYLYSNSIVEAQRQDSAKKESSTVGLQFIGDEFEVRPSAIAKNISIDAGDTYSRNLYDQTQSQLGGFSIYSFPTAQIELDTAGGNFVDYHFYLNADSLYNTNIQPAVYYSTIANTGQLLGLSLDLSLTNRNIFGGGESYTIAGEGATELSLTDLANNTYSVGISNHLEFPRFIRYPFIYDYIENHLPTEEENKHASNHLVARFMRQANTRTSLDYRYTLRSQFYLYHSFSASFGYSWQINKNYNFELDHIGFDWWIPTLFNSFTDIISDNQYFLRSFDQRLLTGVLFRRARLDYVTQQPNLFGERWSASADFETSGLEIMAVDGIGNLFGDKNNITLGNSGFSKYLRLDLSGTYKRHFQNETEVAFRITSGASMRLDTSNVPYIKQFYVGGPYSLRAWPVRGIGPGNNYDEAALESNFPPYFTGNFKFEANAEYRFKMFWYLHGAVFIDAGNVWNIFDDNLEGNTTLEWDSYKDIALGTGFGLRLDYTLFVFRLDLGYPIKNPYKLGPENSYFNPVLEWSFNNIQWNIAFGYPF